MSERSIENRLDDLTRMIFRIAENQGTISRQIAHGFSILNTKMDALMVTESQLEVDANQVVADFSSFVTLVQANLAALNTEVAALKAAGNAPDLSNVDQILTNLDTSVRGAAAALAAPAQATGTGGTPPAAPVVTTSTDPATGNVTTVSTDPATGIVTTTVTDSTGKTLSTTQTNSDGTPVTA